MQGSDETNLIEAEEGGVVRLTLNRPKAFNSLDFALLDALHDAGLIDLTETVVVIHNFAELSEERRRVAAARNTRNHRARRAAAKGV